MRERSQSKATQSSAGIELNGIVVIVGNYGSGKTEIAINLAIDQQSGSRAVRIADLDLVNPYFRTREARRLLSARGIDVILPPEPLLQADLPILSPLAAGAIRHSGDLTILDAGGDGVGATALSALADAFDKLTHRPIVLQIVNPYRPKTQTIEQCFAMRAVIESASGLKVTGWVGNANLMEETTPEHIRHGYRFMTRLAQAGPLPLVFIAVLRDMMDHVGLDAIKCPVLPMDRRLALPWKTPSVWRKR